MTLINRGESARDAAVHGDVAVDDAQRGVLGGVPRGGAVEPGGELGLPHARWLIRRCLPER
jgi:hypothetical protein